MQKISESSPFVKPKTNWKPARFALVILEKHRIGYPDELAFLPICSACGELITDLESANIEAVDGEPIPVGMIDGLLISRLPGEVFAFHVPGCVPQGLIGWWKTLDTVVRNDQRYEFEK